MVKHYHQAAQQLVEEDMDDPALDVTDSSHGKEHESPMQRPLSSYVKQLLVYRRFQAPPPRPQRMEMHTTDNDATTTTTTTTELPFGGSESHDCEQKSLRINKDEKEDDVELGMKQSLPTTPLTASSEESSIASIPVSVVCRNDSEEEQLFGHVLKDRATWLVGLLVMQSCSSFILKNNQEFLSKYMVIVQFLTMLVGAGGNAGNQASVRVIRGLAVGTINSDTIQPFLKREMKMGLSLCLILGLAGCIRAAIFMTPLAETVAITISLVMIVAISIAIGAVLPLGMTYVGIDPAHSSTTIQVLMDILGVTITVYISGAILESPLGAMLGETNTTNIQ